jgi:hypothetical protein
MAGRRLAGPASAADFTEPSPTIFNSCDLVARKYHAVMLSEAKHLICFRGEPIKNDQRFFASLRMTL